MDASSLPNVGAGAVMLAKDAPLRLRCIYRLRGASSQHPVIGSQQCSMRCHVCICVMFAVRRWLMSRDNQFRVCVHLAHDATGVSPEERFQ